MTLANFAILQLAHMSSVNLPTRTHDFCDFF